MAGKKQQADDAQEEVIEITDEDQVEEGEEGKEPDRGDEPEPEVNADNLKKVAGAADEAEEEGTEEESEDAGGKKPPPKTVPYARVAELSKKNKNLEERLAALEAAKEAEPEEEEEQAEPYDFKAKNKEKLKLLSEGDLDGAAELEEEIRQQTQAAAEAQATVNAVKQMTQQQATRDFNKAVADVLKAHPWLDDKGDEADEEAIEDVMAKRDFYITRKGMTPADALRAAAEKVAKTRTPDESDESDESDDDSEESKAAAAKKAAAERKAAAIKKGAAASEKQPPAVVKGKGNRTGEDAQLNVEEMDEETFDKLPAAEKKRLRGD